MLNWIHCSPNSHIIRKTSILLLLCHGIVSGGNPGGFIVQAGHDADHLVGIIEFFIHPVYVF